MADWVLDASAVLAFLFREPGADRAAAALDRALISSVNLSEIIAKLIDKGQPEREAVKIATGMPFDVIAFDAAFSVRTGAMRATTRSQGLSLGDRACLALAQRERLPVLTADSAWIGLDIGVEIRLIR